MKKIGFGALLVLLAYAPVATQNTWFKIHDLGFVDENPWTIAPLGNDFVVLVFSIGFSYPLTRNEVIRFDSVGEIKWRSFLVYPPESNADFAYHDIRAMTIAKDSSIYAISHTQKLNGDFYFLVNKFTPDGALIWFKTCGIPGNSVRPCLEGIVLSEDSLGLVLTGADLLTGKLVVCKIDSSGQQEFGKVVDAPAIVGVGNYTPVVRMPDKTYKVAYNENVLLEDLDYLVSLSATGDLQHAFVNPLTGRAHDLKLHPNGNLVYLSHERNPPMFEWGGLRVQMLTPEFDTLWSHLYYDVDLPYLIFDNSFIRNLSIAPDGRILAMGYDSKNCVLACYDPEGTLLWARDVALEEFSGRKFHYCSWAADGGILVNGYVSGTVNGEYDSQMFLLKLDSVGCLVPGCQQTIITEVHEPRSLGFGLGVAPNPVTDHLRFLPDASGNFPKAYTLTIFNAAGGVALHQVSPDLASPIQIGHLPVGLYTYRIETEGGIAAGKFVRQ